MSTPCPFCSRPIEATRVSTHTMYSCHLFGRLTANTIKGLIAEWQAEADAPDARYGPPYLCPVTVMAGEKELRRVGPMVFPDDLLGTRSNRGGLRAWERAVSDDPDISRLLAERSNAVSEDVEQ